MAKRKNEVKAAASAAVKKSFNLGNFKKKKGFKFKKKFKDKKLFGKKRKFSKQRRHFRD